MGEPSGIKHFVEQDYCQSSHQNSHSGGNEGPRQQVRGAGLSRRRFSGRFEERYQSPDGNADDESRHRNDKKGKAQTGERPAARCALHALFINP